MRGYSRFTEEFWQRFSHLLHPVQILHFSVKVLTFGVIFLGLFLLIFEIYHMELNFDNLVKKLTIRILELVILYEIFRAVLSIFEYQRVKLVFLVDASISFMLRELIITVYSGKLSLEMSLSIGVVMLLLAVLRVAVVRFSPATEQKQDSHGS